MAGRTSDTPIRVAIVGASGYGGGELLRILLGHPHATVVAATSRKHAGQPVHAVHDVLLGRTELRFSGHDPADAAREADCVVFALPHGEAATRMRDTLAAAPHARVIDLSGDFRLSRADEWEAAYGGTHPAPELASEFVYGLTELNRDRIREARLVANPGCFATGAILALAPLARAGALTGDVALSGVTGSSGSGAEAKAATHHPTRAEDFRTYKPLAHQHVPEIVEALTAAGADGLRLAMVPHSAPLVRGIFTTAFVFPKEPWPAGRLAALYREFYAGEPFVRMRDGTPRAAAVRGTNYCDLTVAEGAGGRHLVATGAIDNLGKGMAGQAVQNLNLMFGLPETTGLTFPGLAP